MSMDESYIWQRRPGVFLLFAIGMLLVSLWMTSEGLFWLPEARFDGLRGFCLAFLLYWIYRWFKG